MGVNDDKEENKVTKDGREIFGRVWEEFLQINAMFQKHQREFPAEGFENILGTHVIKLKKTMKIFGKRRVRRGCQRELRGFW